MIPRMGSLGAASTFEKNPAPTAALDAKQWHWAAVALENAFLHSAERTGPVKLLQAIRNGRNTLAVWLAGFSQGGVGRRGQRVYRQESVLNRR